MTIPLISIIKSRAYLYPLKVNALTTPILSPQLTRQKGVVLFCNTSHRLALLHNHIDTSIGPYTSHLPDYVFIVLPTSSLYIHC